MSVDNQIEIPQSFMACMLTEQAQTLAVKENFTEQEVLVRCHQGLLADPPDFTENESEWVILRLAELLGRAAPKSGDGDLSVRYDQIQRWQPAVKDGTRKSERVTGPR